MLKMVILLHIPGASCFTWLFFAMLIPLLLGLLLGYWLWHRYLRKYEDAEAELKACRQRLQALEKDYAALKLENEKLSQELEGLRSDRGAGALGAAALPADQAAERSLLSIDYAALFADTNLQVIEGIGPKVEATLKGAGIANWRALAAASPQEIKEILDEQSAMKMLDPASWPRQAGLADAGKWEELVEYQHFLDAGRETTGDFDNPAKIEVMAERLLDQEGNQPASRSLGALSYTGLFSADDLQIIEGIGPKIDALLKDKGYGTWSKLGMADADTLREILAAEGSAFQMADPTSWPRQAQLAASGKWASLIDYQRFLDAGRESTGHTGTPAKVERMAASLTGFANSSPDDLKIIEGIGPKIEALLKENGIANWYELSRQTTEELLEILAAGGDAFRMAYPASWPVQARLAVAGDWKALRDYQEFLEGGKDPG